MVDYALSYRAYRRLLRHPLRTSHGDWSVREGLLFRLEDENGQRGWGEIAPLPWFGSETYAEALQFCANLRPADILRTDSNGHRLPHKLTDDQVRTIPANLPACRFGFGSALESLGLTNDRLADWPSKHSGLLSPGPEALAQWPRLWAQGYRTFKWKINVLTPPAELALLEQLISALPSDAKLRLDANAGLKIDLAHQWLQACDRHNFTKGANIEYLEQPLGIGQVEQMIALNSQYQTAIALDESVATLTRLKACYDLGWRGIFVVKPAIMGFPWELREFCQIHNFRYRSLFCAGNKGGASGRSATSSESRDRESRPWVWR